MNYILLILAAAFIVAGPGMADENISSNGYSVVAPAVPESSFKCAPGSSPFDMTFWTTYLHYDTGYELRFVDCGSGIKCLKVMPFAY